MPLISGSYNPAVGPILQVAIVDAEFLMKGPTDGSATPKLRMFNALVDTGATSTCITDNVIRACGLIATGKTIMTGSTGEKPVDQFTFGVAFLTGQKQQPTGEYKGDLHVIGVQGCEFHNAAVAFDVLLGRDIICQGSFMLSFDGHFILSI